ncbi:hypothetical protein [Sphingobacterium faecium]|uniref:hypothetical protein n=1 Tax=Sphingobacterium faecium TaxID=34087 RepID=UPI00320B2D15
MKRNNCLKSNVMALVAVITILSFLTLKVSGLYGQHKRMTVSIYFHGNPSSPAEVADENRWNPTPNGETCNAVNQKACMILLEQTDLTISYTLDPAKINLDAVYTGAAYIPRRIGGSSSTPFNPINRN